MKINSQTSFSKLNYKNRLKTLVERSIINAEDSKHFQQNNDFPITLAESLIENSIGYLHIPLGVVIDFPVDNKNYAIPMAIEESSVIAALNKTKKWINENGTITTNTIGNAAIGQIQIATVKNFILLKSTIEKHKNELITAANTTVAAGMTKRGGGVIDIKVRKLTRCDNQTMAVIHVIIDTCEAMGANLINQVCEYLKKPIEQLTNEKISMCILSNLVDTHLTQVKIELNNIEPELGKAIEEASVFAETDPYRAATNNKGIMNGIDAVLIATGNDWRAVEAAMHSYAAHSGHYDSISHWRYENGKLSGELTAPINVGIVGGITQVHPTTKLCLKMLGVKSTNELAKVIAAVGLTQNLGAIRALVTVGITKGHMNLHLTNLCLACGATLEEIELVKPELSNVLKNERYITHSHIHNSLIKIRNKESRSG